MIWVVRVLLVCGGLLLFLIGLARQMRPQGDFNENLTYLGCLAGVVCFVLFVVSFFVKLF